MANTILIVDDEKTLRYFLRLTLQDKGYEVVEAADGKAAMRLLKRTTFDVALVDLHLTDMNGLDIMRHLRKTEPHTQVIILTGHASVDSAVEALRQGAHDYLVKPCDTDELLTSVADAIALQNAEPPVTSPIETQLLQAKDLQLNQASRHVSRNGETINLTPTEFDILATLMAHLDVAIDATTLVRLVRGYEASEIDARAIARVHVHRLRHKLEINPADPQYVVTIAGGRYIINS